MKEVARQRLLVVLPQQLAAFHLKQCRRHLQASPADALQLLYAAQSAHMALHTMLMEIRYADTGLEVLVSRKGKEPEEFKEGVRVRRFSELIDEIDMSDRQRTDIALLTAVRDRLQHPVAGPMGYEIERLVFGIEAAIQLQEAMWDHQFVITHSDDVARRDSLVASAAILELCSKIINKYQERKS